MSEARTIAFTGLKGLGDEESPNTVGRHAMENTREQVAKAACDRQCHRK